MNAKKMALLAPVAAVLLLSTEAWAQSDTSQTPPTRSTMHKKPSRMHGASGSNTSRAGTGTGDAAGEPNGGPGTTMGNGMDKGAQTPAGNTGMGAGGATGGTTGSGGKAGY